MFQEKCITNRKDQSSLLICSLTTMVVELVPLDVLLVGIVSLGLVGWFGGVLRLSALGFLGFVG